jgi:hypothetical protein
MAARHRRPAAAPRASPARAPRFLRKKFNASQTAMPISATAPKNTTNAKSAAGPEALGSAMRARPNSGALKKRKRFSGRPNFAHARALDESPAAGLIPYILVLSPRADARRASKICINNP